MYNYRFDIIPKSPQNSHLSEYLTKLSKDKDAQIYKSKIYWLSTTEPMDHFDLEYIAQEILSNKLLELAQFSSSPIPFKYDQFIQVSFRPGVRDNRAQATHDAIQIFYPKLDFDLHTGDGFFIQGDIKNEIVQKFALNYLVNPLLNNLKISLKHDFEEKRFNNIYFPTVNLHKESDQLIDLNLDDNQLVELSNKRCLALTLNEMKQIQKYIHQEKSNRIQLGLEKINEVELEILAQTWSEHCKHKIFAAQINYTESDHSYVKLPKKKINSLYKEFIKNTTNEIKKDWLVSVFSDNAGIVRFDNKYDLCIKVETHNSPCALDPYGGALTGILGVNRDIIGTGLGARPIGNMDVFCIGQKEENEQLPPKLLHPKRMLKEVHRGVMDGGNKSGIPTLNGSMHFHRNWLGKPLIYVGSIGILPQKFKNQKKLPSGKYHQPGDLIIICGGRVGADGIHGATFSSMELKDDALSTYVQIGDPYTQKKLTEFVIKARDKGLFSSITDNGAGGLSSSIGEMAQKTNGAKIQLEGALVKYPGLKNFEIMISESQERMTLAVPPENLNELNELAKLYEVELANMGEFTDTGFLDIYDGEKQVCHLSVDFMHNGLTQMQLEAQFNPVEFPFPNISIKIKRCL
jgi:phosphoribosylformylglycinamidine (FGAM) synthase-like enzyme/phosphoribosylformylglycinamidine (FGAM) synthase PurS component